MMLTIFHLLRYRDDRHAIQVYRFTPNTKGQTSTEKEAGVPIYRWAVAVKDLVGFGSSYKLYRGNEDKIDTWRGTRPSVIMDSLPSFFLGLDPWLNMIIHKHSDKNAKVASIGQKNSILNKKVEIGPGVDPLDVLCYAVIMDEMLENSPKVGCVAYSYTDVLQ